MGETPGKSRKLEKHVENLFGEITRRLLRTVRLLEGWNARNKVHLVGTPERSAHIQTPADPHSEKEGDVDVRCEEVLCIPRKEDLVAIDEDEDGRPESTPDGEAGLQRAPVCELSAIDALNFVTTPEAEVGYVY